MEVTIDKVTKENDMLCFVVKIVDDENNVIETKHYFVESDFTQEKLEKSIKNVLIARGYLDKEEIPDKKFLEFVGKKFNLTTLKLE